MLAKALEKHVKGEFSTHAENSTESPRAKIDKKFVSNILFCCLETGRLGIGWVSLYPTENGVKLTLYRPAPAHPGGHPAVP